MKCNTAWHECHTMPENATLEREALWHIAHKQHCGCTAIPKRVVANMHRMGMVEEPIGFNVGLDENFHPDTAHLAGHVPLPDC